MKMYLKVIGGVHVTLAFLKSPPAAQTAQKMAPGTGTDASPVAQRLLANTWPKKQVQHKTYMQTREKTKKQYNNT